MVEAVVAVEVEAVEVMVEMAAAKVVEAMVVVAVVETVVVEEEEAPQSITSTSPSHKSTMLLLTHTPIKPTLFRQLQLLPPLWQPLLL